MAKVKSKAYASSHVILLAFNWEEGKNNENFIGFAIQRTPGFLKKGGGREAKSPLSNRLNFNGPAKQGEYTGSDKNPIQKFMWWDAQINDADEGKIFTYTITPALYDKTDAANPVKLVTEAAKDIKVKVPSHKTSDGKVTTYFNRAVVSSQSFSSRFVDRKTNKLIESKRKEAYTWLANGLPDAFTELMKDAESMEGAIYHLHDNEWVIPAMKAFHGNVSMVLDFHKYTKDTADGKHKKDEPKDPENAAAVAALTNIGFTFRDKTNIMHDKFLVQLKAGQAKKVLMGSANFTTGALTSQANLLHIFDSPELAQLYLAQKQILQTNPGKADTAKKAKWSKTIKAGNASVRIFFSPEPDDSKKPNPARLALKPVTEAIKNAKQSIVFCIFTPTDKLIRDEIFKQADKGKMMFGLVNSIGKNPPGGDPKRQDVLAKVEIFNRSQKDKDVFSHRAFDKGNTPNGFWTEISNIQKQMKLQLDDDGDGAENNATNSTPPEVYIHHKFIVIDGETDNPVIYTGSANFSGNSSYNNDENMLEIKDSPELAKTYLAEFMRLYEHYRARSMYQRFKEAKATKAGSRTSKQKEVLTTFKLVKDKSWAKDDYTDNSPESKARINMAK
jgi:phosphatidylserine/phosphatidylglycerophosphate/cardiolipin synthase-like enzyme